MLLLRRFLTSSVLFLLFYVLDGDAYKLELHHPEKMRKKGAMAYLSNYGYFDGYCSSTNCKLDAETTTRMIKDFQSFANLETTGVIDSPTIKQMQIPRCANKDKKYRGFTGRQKRYNPQGTVWSKVKRGEPLTWRYDKPDAKTPIEGITEDLSRDVVKRVLNEAMKKWSAVAKISFKEIYSGVPDLWIYFGFKDHGDIFPFDGPKGELAHAFYPLNNKNQAGDLHFDDAEDFTVDSSDGVNFMWVATHEIGHSIGLAHSNIPDAVMFPYYQDYRPDFQLDEDDIRGIQSIYGKADGIKDKTKSTCPAKDVTSIWRDPMTKSYKLITRSRKGFAFDKSGTLRSVSLPVSEVDAGFTGKIYADSEEEYTVLFSGSKYSVYTKDLQLKSDGHSIYRVIDRNGKRNPLQLHFPESVKNIRAAIRRQANGKVYLFYNLYGQSYYRRYNLQTHKFYRSRKSGKMDWKTNTAWKGLPKEGPDAAISSKDLGTYFVVRDTLYRFDEKRKMYPGYPKRLGEDGMFRCPPAGREP